MSYDKEDAFSEIENKAFFYSLEVTDSVLLAGNWTWICSEDGQLRFQATSEFNEKTCERYT